MESKESNEVFKDNSQGSSCPACFTTDSPPDSQNTRHVQRDNKEIKSMVQRLSRIEGQVRGVKKMLEDDRYCVDILVQVASIQAALNGFNKQLLESHIKNCVCNDIKAGSDEAVEELCGLLKNIMK